MRNALWLVGVASCLFYVPSNLQAQNQAMFAPFDCRAYAEPEETYTETILIDSTLLQKEVVASAPLPQTLNWQSWTVVENLTFGKDRGALTMIADLEALHPFFRDKVRQLIDRCKAQGIHLAVVETYRTHAKQNEYRSMGRRYTNSTGGRSKHQYGLAVDVVPLVKGVAVWDNVLLWKRIGVIGEKLGMRWGGRWRKPYDPGHFEWTGGLTSNHLAAGMLPHVPDDKYPCAHEDIEVLRQYWSEWERYQEQLLSMKTGTARRTTN